MGNVCRGASTKENGSQLKEQTLPTMGIELEERKFDGVPVVQPASLSLDLSRINDNHRSFGQGAKGSLTVRDPKTGRRMKKPPKHALRGSLTARAAKDPTMLRTPPRQEDLPYGWEIQKTQEGKVFYFNTLTSQKQWMPPNGSNTGWNWDPKKQKDRGANSWAAY